MVEGKHISEVFAKAIDEQRDAINSLYKQILGANGSRHSEAFLEHVIHGIGPIVEVVHVEFPERVRATTLELFRVSLELFNNRLLGEESKVPTMATLWAELFPEIGKWIARDPRRVLGGLCNLFLQIDRMQPHRVTRWVQMMRDNSPRIQNVEQLFDVATISAWLSGMAMVRTTAIEKALSLSEDLRDAIFRSAEFESESCSEELLRRWKNDPWASVDSNEKGANDSIKHVTTCGAFRGIGGLFLHPPEVFSKEKRLYVSDGIQQWRISADRFGVVFIPVDAAVSIDKTRGQGKEIVGAAASGPRWREALRHYPFLDDTRSVASNESTIAVTIPTSFHVFLFSSSIEHGHG